MPQNPIDDKSGLTQVMGWCGQASSHYLRQCWPRSMSPYGVNRPLTEPLLKSISHCHWYKISMNTPEYDWNRNIFNINHNILTIVFFKLQPFVWLLQLKFSLPVVLGGVVDGLTTRAVLMRRQSDMAAIRASLIEFTAAHQAKNSPACHQNVSTQQPCR